MWLAYVGDNIVPLYYKILAAQSQNEIDAAVATLHHKFAFVVQHSNGMINGRSDCYFNGTEQFTVIDCAILPFLERMVVVLQHWKGVEIFAARNENSNVNKWFTYWQFARKRECLQRTIYKLDWMGASFPQNPFMKELNMADIKTFEPAKYMCSVYEIYAKPQ